MIIFSLTHMYASPGIYQVEVVIQGNSGQSLTTAILIEEPVSEVILNGPDAVPLNR